MCDSLTCVRARTALPLLQLFNNESFLKLKRELSVWNIIMATLHQGEKTEVVMTKQDILQKTVTEWHTDL